MNLLSPIYIFSACVGVVTIVLFAFKRKEGLVRVTCVVVMSVPTTQVVVVDRMRSNRPSDLA